MGKIYAKDHQNTPLRTSATLIHPLGNYTSAKYGKISTLTRCHFSAFYFHEVIYVWRFFRAAWNASED